MESSRRQIAVLLIAGFLISSAFLISCSPGKRLHAEQAALLQTTPLQRAHVGICFYEPAVNRLWLDYQSDHYFVPASNVKIPTCYAAMKYLGDSLVTFFARDSGDVLLIEPAGDPTFLHEGYHSQPAFDYLKRSGKRLLITGNGWHETALGNGWSWNDYNDDYMAERSPMPIYGNVLHWKLERSADSISVTCVSNPRSGFHLSYDTTSSRGLEVVRAFAANDYQVSIGREKRGEVIVPFVTNGL
ncbi:MAG TPA: D-alanyl-D-alanine carboxypeptidase, partial [Chitinophagaceae bacterium]